MSYLQTVKYLLLLLYTSKAPIVSLSKKRNPFYLVLVDSRNRFKRDFTIKLKQIEGVMEDCLKCQISSFVKYRQNPNQVPLHEMFGSVKYGSENDFTI